MSRALAISLGLTFFLFGAKPARAGALGEAARFAFLDAPPPLPKDLAPEPTREEDEFPRRTWETFPSAGVGAPFCRGNAFGLGHCGDTAPGVAVGAGLLYRVSPYIALGLDASFARFTSRPPTAAAPYSRASFIGVLVRGYFLDRGMLDPYVETGFGQATATSGYVDAGTEVRTESAAPALMAGAGIDFWVAPYLRIGPALSYRIAWLTDVRGCYAATCTSYGVDERGAVGSYASLGFRATIALGREM